MECANVTGEPLVILLVEDDQDHAEMIKRNFFDHRIANKIYHVSDGEQALDYLFHRGDYADNEKSPVPHIILLDLRLPKIDGIEVLKEIKESPQTKMIPVVVLTTSNAENDIKKAYDSHVNSYLVKPVGFEQLSEMIESLGYYWLAWNCAPHE